MVYVYMWKRYTYCIFIRIYYHTIITTFFKATEVTLPYGSVLGGWGRGKFREKGQKPCEENEMEFQCAPDMAALLDNKCFKLSELLDSEKQSQPEGPKVAYHKVSLDPTGVWTFDQDGLKFRVLVEDWRSCFLFHHLCNKSVFTLSRQHVS